MKHARRSVWAGVALGMLLAARPVPAAEPPSVRSYDLRDLMITVPDFDLGKPAAPGPDRKAVVAGLTATLRAALPAEFAESADIKESGGQFTVSTDPAGHACIQSLLQDLHALRARQITVEVRFIALDAASRNLIESDELRRELALAEWQGAHGGGVVELSPELEQQLIRLAQQLPGATQMASPRATVFDRQRAVVKITSSTAYIADVLPVKGEGAVGYDPQVAEVESGITVDLRATSSTDGAHVGVDMTSTLARLFGIDTVDAPSAPDQKAQRPDVQTTKTPATFTAASGQALLAGGGVLTRSKPGAAIQTDKELFILVKATAIRTEVERAQLFPQLDQARTR